MIKAAELRKGMAVYRDEETFVVHDVRHVVKGKGRAYMQAKLKNVKSGQIVDARYRMDEGIDQPFMEKKQMEFLYQEGENLVLMDLQTYDQSPVAAEYLGESVKFLKPNEQVEVATSDGQVFELTLPHVVELEVTETTPQVKGATATNQLKDATLETGARIRVPPFVEMGERVRVDTRTGEYLERAKPGVG